MKLDEILQKTKAKSEHVKLVRNRIEIATIDRPYSNLDISDKSAREPNKIENKSETNWRQNREQIGNKLITNRKQTGDKNNYCIENQEQTGNTIGNTIRNKPETDQEQTGNKLGTNLEFSSLVGLQRALILFLHNECKFTRSTITTALTLEHISYTVKTTTDSAKTTLRRLEKKGFILRKEFKIGRGGWSKYELPEKLYHELLNLETRNKLETNWKQTVDKLEAESETQSETTQPSSSNINIKKTTTTELSTEWNFDITPYSRFGFTVSQLKQIAVLRVISAGEVEQSLIEFSYDLDNNNLPLIKTNKINFLMGLLRKGVSYVSERYKKEEEEMILEMARRVEEKRKKLLEAKLITWEANLKEEEKRIIEKNMPTTLMVLFRTHGINNLEVKNWLFNYFLTNMVNKG